MYLTISLSTLGFTERRPQYTIDLNHSTCSFHSVDRRKNEYTFTVEQGCRFYLQLNLTASPFPTRADLYKDGKLVESTRNGTIFVGIDRIGIQSVDRQAYAGSYRIVSSNDAGHGEITFNLRVQGMNVWLRIISYIVTTTKLL